MSMNIKAIIFDFGGVLLKWNPYNILQPYFPGQAQAADDFLREINFMEWNAQQDKGRPFAEGVKVLSQQFPQYAHIVRAFHEQWEKSMDGQYDGSVQLLRELKEKGYPLHGLSNWSAETFPIARQRHDFFELFDSIILSGEVKLIKPDPAIFNHCLQVINRPAHVCLFIDDSEANIVTASQLGFDTIHFISPEHLREELNDRKLL
jgi:2-haloacid dehalogenase